MQVPQPEITLDGVLLKVLASDTRRELLRRLADRRMTVTELARRLDLGKATVSEHLKILREAELVTRHDDPGRLWVYHDLTPRGRRLLDPPERQGRVRLLVATALLALLGGILVGAAIPGQGDDDGAQEMASLGTYSLPLQDADLREGTTDSAGGPARSSGGGAGDASGATATPAPDGGAPGAGSGTMTDGSDGTPAQPPDATTAPATGTATTGPVVQDTVTATATQTTATHTATQTTATQTATQATATPRYAGQAPTTPAPAMTTTARPATTTATPAWDSAGPPDGDVVALDPRVPDAQVATRLLDSGDFAFSIRGNTSPAQAVFLSVARMQADPAGGSQALPTGPGVYYVVHGSDLDRDGGTVRVEALQAAPQMGSAPSGVVGPLLLLAAVAVFAAVAPGRRQP